MAGVPGGDVFAAIGNFEKVEEAQKEHFGKREAAFEAHRKTVLAMNQKLNLDTFRNRKAAEAKELEAAKEQARKLEESMAKSTERFMRQQDVSTRIGRRLDLAEATSPLERAILRIDHEMKDLEKELGKAFEPGTKELTTQLELAKRLRARTRVQCFSFPF